MPKAKIQKTDSEPEREVFLAFSKREKEKQKFCKLFYEFFLELVSRPEMDSVNTRVFLFYLLNSDFEGKIDFSQREVATICGVNQSTVSKTKRILIDFKILLELKRMSFERTDLFLNPEACWKSTPNRRVEKSLYFQGRFFADSENKLNQKKEGESEN